MYAFSNKPLDNTLISRLKNFLEKKCIHCYLFSPFRPVGSFEVGVYDYNPPSLLLRGDSTGNGTPAVLKYVNWPGKSYQLLWRLMSPKKKLLDCRFFKGGQQRRETNSIINFFDGLFFTPNVHRL